MLKCAALIGWKEGWDKTVLLDLRDMVLLLEWFTLAASIYLI